MDDSFDDAPMPGSDVEMNDSFDDPIFMMTTGKCDRMSVDADSENTDTSSSSEVKDTVSTLSAIMQSVIRNKTYTGRDISRALNVCLNSSDSVETNSIVRVLRDGTEKIFVEELVERKTIVAVFTFLSKLSLKSHTHECNFPLAVLREEIEGFNRSEVVLARVRSCQMMASMLETGAEEEEADVILDDSYSALSIIPSSIMVQWAKLLCQRRLDKEPAVRSAALYALAKLPMTEVVDHEGNSYDVNDLFLKSMTDKSWDVRRAAIRLVALTSPSTVTQCICYIRLEDNIAGRMLMAERLIADVHFKVFTKKQRIDLVESLQNDPDDAVRNVIARKLCPRWLSVLKDGKEASGQLLDDNGEPWGEQSMPAHPISLLSHLNPNENEETIKKLMIVSLSHYMECAVGNRIDTSAFIEFLGRTPIHRLEMEELITKQNFESTLESTEPKKLTNRLFQLRCTVDLVASILSSSTLIARKDHALTRLMPNLRKSATVLKKFVARVLEPSDDATEADRGNAEFCVKQVMCMLRLLDRDGEVGVPFWWNCLCYIAADSSITPSPALVEMAVTEILQYVVRGNEHIAETVEWACYAIGELLMADSDPDVDIASQRCIIRNGEVETIDDEPYSIDVLRRCAYILSAILSFAGVGSMTTLLRNACDKLIPRLALSTNPDIRSMACRLVGLSSCIDVVSMKMRAVSLRHTLDIDTDDVKVVALRALVDIVFDRGVRDTATSMFPEIKSDKTNPQCVALTLLVEKIVESCPVSDVSSICFDALRLMYKTCIQWPSLIGSILCRVFDGSESHKALSDALDRISVFFDGFVLRGLAGRLQLMSGFLNAVNKMDSQGLTKLRLGQMSTFVMERLNSTSEKANHGRMKSRNTGDQSEAETKPKLAKISVHLLLSKALLWKIASAHDGIAASGLASNSLSGINVDHIGVVNLPSVLATAIAVVKKLDVECSPKRMIDGVKRFAKAIEVAMKRQGLEVVSAVRGCRKRVNELKEEDPDDFDDDELSAMRSTSSRLRGEGGRWSRSRSQIKEEPQSQLSSPCRQLRTRLPFPKKVKSEQLDEELPSDEECSDDSIVIDSDDSSVILLDEDEIPRTPSTPKRPRMSMVSQQSARVRLFESDDVIVIDDSSDSDSDF